MSDNTGASEEYEEQHYPPACHGCIARAQERDAALADVARLTRALDRVRAAVIDCAYCNGVGSLLRLPGDVTEPCPACSGLHAAIEGSEGSTAVTDGRKAVQMHYKNGREAKNGDKVVLFPSWGAPVVGILYDAQAGNDHCNGKIAATSPNDTTPDLKYCLHFDDVKALCSLAHSPAPDGVLVEGIGLVSAKK